MPFNKKRDDDEQEEKFKEHGFMNVCSAEGWCNQLLKSFFFINSKVPRQAKAREGNLSERERNDVSH